MNKIPKDPGSIYLPDRYKERIEAKKRRRLIKKIAVIGIIVAMVSVFYLILSGALSDSLNQSPPSLPGSIVSAPAISPASPPHELTNPLAQNITEIRNTDIITGKGLITHPIQNIRSLDNATALLHQDYPAPEYTIIWVNVTDRFAERTLYEFKIRPEVSQDSAGFSVFIDSMTGISILRDRKPLKSLLTGQKISW